MAIIAATIGDFGKCIFHACLYVLLSAGLGAWLWGLV